MVYPHLHDPERLIEMMKEWNELYKSIEELQEDKRQFERSTWALLAVPWAVSTNQRWSKRHVDKTWQLNQSSDTTFRSMAHEWKEALDAMKEMCWLGDVPKMPDICREDRWPYPEE